MKAYQGKQRICIKTIAMAVVCLFLVNDIVLAQPASYNPTDTATLAIQSIFNPIINAVGVQRQKQVELELSGIIAMALRGLKRDGGNPNAYRSFLNINSALDGRCSNPRHQGRGFVERTLEVVDCPAILEDNSERPIVIRIKTATNLEPQKHFKIIFKGDKLDDMFDASKIEVMEEPSRTNSVALVLNGLHNMDRMFTAYQEMLSNYGMETRKKVKRSIAEINQARVNQDALTAAQELIDIMPVPRCIDIKKHGDRNWLNWFTPDIDNYNKPIADGCMTPCQQCILGIREPRSSNDPLPVVIRKILATRDMPSFAPFSMNDLLEWRDPFFRVYFDSIIEFIAREQPSREIGICTKGVDLKDVKALESAARMAKICSSQKHSVFLSFHLGSSQYDIIKAIGESGGKSIPEKFREEYTDYYAANIRALRPILDNIVIYLVSLDNKEIETLINNATFEVFEEAMKKAGFKPEEVNDIMTKIRNKPANSETVRINDTLSIDLWCIDKNGRGDNFIKKLELGAKRETDPGIVDRAGESRNRFILTSYPRVEVWGNGDVIVYSMTDGRILFKSTLDDMFDAGKADIVEEQSDLSLRTAAEAFRYMNALMGSASGAEPVEEVMNVMITTRCPLKCPICLAELLLKDNGRHRDVDKKALHSIFDQLKGFKRINLVGPGETTAYGKDKFNGPGVSEDFLDIVRYAASCAGEVRIVTSGYFIPTNPEDAEKFFKQFPSNVVWVFSVDNWHEEQMAGKNKTLLQLINMVEELADKGVTHTAYYIVSKNEDDFHKITERFGLLEKLRSDSENILMLPVCEQGGAKTNQIESKPLSSEYVNGYAYLPEKTFLYIDLKGNVVTSHLIAFMLEEERQRFSTDNILGNIYKEPLASILVNSLFLRNYGMEKLLDEKTGILLADNLKSSMTARGPPSNDTQYKIVKMTKDYATQHKDELFELWKMINDFPDMTPDDLVADKWEQGKFSQNHERNFYGKWDYSYTVENRKGKIIGAIICYERPKSESGSVPDSLYIHYLMTDHDHQQNGLATRLILLATENLIKQGRYLHLEGKELLLSAQVNETHNRITHFFESMGFDRRGEAGYEGLDLKEISYVADAKVTAEKATQKVLNSDNNKNGNNGQKNISISNELLLLNHVSPYLRGYPVDETIDLSLIPKEDLEANMKTWAYIIALNNTHGLDVNYIFKSTDETYKTEAKRMLFEKIEEIKEIDIEKVEARVTDTYRPGALQIHIMKKEDLEKLKDIPEDVLPIALSEGTMLEGTPLRDFMSASVIGLAQATCKRMQTEKNPHLLEIIEQEILPRMQHIYQKLFPDKDIKEIVTKETVLNMINDNPTIRKNLAIALALPPIIRAAIQYLKDYHDRLHLLLQAA